MTHAPRPFARLFDIAPYGQVLVTLEPDDEGDRCLQCRIMMRGAIGTMYIKSSRPEEMQRMFDTVDENIARSLAESITEQWADSEDNDIKGEPDAPTH